VGGSQQCKILAREFLSPMYRSMQHKLATGHLEYFLLYLSVGPTINSDGHLFVNVPQTMCGD